MDIDEISGAIVDAAMKVHTVLGPGLLESAYETCLTHELRSRGLRVLSQVVLPIQYEGIELDVGYRLDLLVEDQIIVEVKAVESLNSLHQAQLLSYLKMSGKQVGLLINFNVHHLRNGIRRVVNNYQKPLRSSATSAV
jgi:GxxExxY protein